MTTPKEALERIIQIYERNAGRQNEKLADIPLVARRALAYLEGDAVEEATILQENVRYQESWLKTYRADIKALEKQIENTPDEAAIRADEREKCERRVEELDCLYVNDERYPFGGTPADPESAIRREAIKECLAAIRSNRREA